MKHLIVRIFCRRAFVGRLLPVCLFTVFAVLSAPSFGEGRPAQDTPNTPPIIAYRVSIANQAAQRFHVQITVENAPSSHVAFAIPAWTPGYYQILHFEKDIEAVHAENGQGQELIVTHPDARTWDTQPDTTQRVVFSYDIHATDAGLGFFGSVLDPKEPRGYINGASALMYVVDQTRQPTSLAVTLPDDWKIATPLAPAAEKAPDTPDASTPTKQTHTEQFQARDYDELIDCPLQMGQFEETKFQVGSIPFRCVTVGKSTLDKSRLSGMLTRIAQAGLSVLAPAGEAVPPSPFAQYVFFYHFGGAGFFGGLEHRNSTVIHFGGSPGDTNSDALVTVTSHEFFHAFNVKRLRPAVLGPFDYTQAARTGALWFAEGVTDYYAERLPLLSGIRDRTWFLTQMSDRIAELEETPARRRISLEEASRKSWEGGSEGFDGLSYYLKGSLAGLYFDMRIRGLTEGAKGLDDALRLLDVRYGQHNIGYPEDALRTALSDTAGTDLGSEYDRIVRGTDEIPWETALSSVGLELRRDRRPFLGIQLEQRSDTEAARPYALVEGVEAGFAGAQMGLKAGDRILQVNAQTVSSRTLPDVLRELPPGSPLTLRITRDGQEQELTGQAGVRYANPVLLLLPRDSLPAKIRHAQETLFARPTPPARKQETAQP